MNAIETAAIPTAVAILQALQQLLANIGTDPAQAVLKIPGAVDIFVGTVKMQFPSLVSAELGAVQTAANTEIASLIASLKAAAPAA